jgi:chromosome segregation ATPase
MNDMASMIIGASLLLALCALALAAWCYKSHPATFTLMDLKERLEYIMAKEQEIIAELTVVKEQLDGANATLQKISTETDGLLGKIEELQAALDNVEIPESIVSLVTEIKEKATAINASALNVDGKVPDAPAPAE